MTRACAWCRAADRATLAGIGLGVALMLQPWWSGGLRAGFFITLVMTLAQIVTSHLPSRTPG